MNSLLAIYAPLLRCALKIVPALLPVYISAAPPFSTEVAQVATGGGHSCARTSLGKIFCWGDNQYGQLGDGTNISRAYALEVPGISGAISIGAGRRHSCAVLQSGAIKCWGNNFAGKLGDGTQINRSSPVDVVDANTGFTAVSLGNNHTCAVSSSGAAKCWGSNSLGQIGNGSTGVQLVPVNVTGLSSGVVAISAGGAHSCAQMSTGGLKCWGDNFFGQLGDGSQIDRRIPVDVLGLDAVSTLSSGEDHTCVVTQQGGAKCWGNNENGNLGDGTRIDRSLPTAVLGVSTGAAQISAGQEHTCVRLVGGTLKCWGAGAFGQLGNGSALRFLTAQDVQWSELAISVQAGEGHSCAITINGSLHCWGDISVGQTGNGGSTFNRLIATKVQIGPSQTVRAGENAHSCAISPTGSLACWGDGQHGQLGDGASIIRFSPVPVTGITNVVDVSLGRTHSCALALGNVSCWGQNLAGQLGDGTVISHNLPSLVAVSNTIALVSGASHSCALNATGEVKCWGANFSGELGNAALGSGAGAPYSATPIAVSDLNSVVSLSAGYLHTCAQTASNTVKCWGGNQYGQLGDGTIDSPKLAGDVVGLSGVVQIAVGLGHSCALTNLGGVKCWGKGDEGQLGNGLWTSQSGITDVQGLTSGVRAIAVGRNHSCALLLNGTIKCWGENANGQLGNGTTVNSAIPINIASNVKAVAAITAGGAYTCATTNTETFCWGSNNFGQLGDGSPNPFLPGIVVGDALFGTRFE